MPDQAMPGQARGLKPPWHHIPIALYPDFRGLTFSRNAAVEVQSLAYSLDRGLPKAGSSASP